MLVSSISKMLADRRDLKTMRNRASRADMAAAMMVLDKIPNCPPDAGDEIFDESSTNPGLK